MAAGQTPRIVKSTLTRPARWFVVTRYREKAGIDMQGNPTRYVVATTKHDVTDQMTAILKPHRKARK